MSPALILPFSRKPSEEAEKEAIRQLEAIVHMAGVVDIMSHDPDWADIPEKYPRLWSMFLCMIDDFNRFCRANSLPTFPFSRT